MSIPSVAGMTEETTPPPDRTSRIRRGLGSRTVIGLAAVVLGLGIGGGAVLLLTDRGDRVESILMSHGEHAKSSEARASADGSCDSHDDDGQRDGTAAGRHDESGDSHHDAVPASQPAAPPAAPR